MVVLGFTHDFLTNSTHKPESAQNIVNDVPQVSILEPRKGHFLKMDVSNYTDIANYTDDCTPYVSVNNFDGVVSYVEKFQILFLNVLMILFP